jgi:hypothetical protein
MNYSLSNFLFWGDHSLPYSREVLLATFEQKPGVMLDLTSGRAVGMFVSNFLYYINIIT